MANYGKSSHEIVAQIKEAGAHFGGLYIDDDEALKLKQSWNTILDELNSYSKEQISEEGFKITLKKIGEKALNLGVIDPNYGNGKEDRLEYATNFLEKCDIYSDKQIKTLCVESLSKFGLNHNIKELIKKQEAVFQNAIDKGYNQQTFELAINNNEYESILEKTIDISTINSTEEVRLQNDFPSGNFLYHGAKTSSIVDILKSGAIMNGQALNKLGEAESRNSGFEGISWSMNEIDALPGDRRHIAGFISAPEAILNTENQLAIPSRPAPYEVVQISSKIIAEKYYTMKTQNELYRSVNGLSGNSVFGNFVEVINSNLDTRNRPSLYAAKDNLLSNPDYTNKLRELYKINDDDTIYLNPGLLQQKNNEIPVGSVWLQAAIDQNRFENTPYANKSVIEIIDSITKESAIDLLKIAKTDWQKNEDALENIDNSNSDVIVPVEKMYLVVARGDLESWIKVIACSEHKPAGVLLYDHSKVRLENFLSDHKGDNDELTAELRSVIKPNNGYVKYSDILGKNFEDSMRAGHKDQVISEKYLDNRRVIKKINDKVTVI